MRKLIGGRQTAGPAPPTHAGRETTLRAVLDDLSRAAPLDARLDIAKRLLTAVARLHERERVHGCLDPSAIRLRGVRSFRVALTPDDEEPQSGIRDTRYAPPEGERSMHGDVYALGAILRELLVDAPPTVMAVLDVMVETNPQARYATAQVAMCAFARAAPSSCEA